MGVSKNRGFLKLDGLFHGKSYQQMDDLGGPPLLLETPICFYVHSFGPRSCQLDFRFSFGGIYFIHADHVRGAWFSLCDKPLVFFPMFSDSHFHSGVMTT